MICVMCRARDHSACPEIKRQADPDLSDTDKAGSSMCDYAHEEKIVKTIGCIVVPSESEMSDDIFVRHMNKRHADSIGGLHSLWRINDSVTVLWRSFHARLHKASRLDHRHADELWMPCVKIEIATIRAIMLSGLRSGMNGCANTADTGEPRLNFCRQEKNGKLLALSQILIGQ